MRRFIVSGSCMECIKSIHVLAKNEGEAMDRWKAEFGENQVLTFQPKVYEALSPLQEMRSKDLRGFPLGHTTWKGDGHVVDIGGYRYNV